MIEILGYPFMQRAFFAGAIVGVLCAIIGVYIVLKSLSFIGAGISHAAFGGVASGFLLGINPTISVTVFCLFTAWGIGFISNKEGLKEDTAVGIFFTSTMALGILMIGLMKGYNTDLFGYFFGSILSVSSLDLYVVIGFGVIVLLTVYLFFKELLFITFNPDHAQVMGLKVEMLKMILLSLIALTVVVSMKVVGIVLVSALLITPAATAYQLARSIRGMMILSTLFSLFAVFSGLILSYYLDVASGATIVMATTVTFFTVLSFKIAYKKIKGIS